MNPAREVVGNAAEREGVRGQGPHLSWAQCCSPVASPADAVDQSTCKALSKASPSWGARAPTLLPGVSFSWA